MKRQKILKLISVVISSKKENLFVNIYTAKNRRYKSIQIKIIKLCIIYLKFLSIITFFLPNMCEL